MLMLWEPGWLLRCWLMMSVLLAPMLVIAASGMSASLNLFRQVLRAIPRGVQKRNGPPIALEARGSSMSGLRPAIAKGEWLGCSSRYSLRGYIH